MHPLIFLKMRCESFLFWPSINLYTTLKSSFIFDNCELICKGIKESVIYESSGSVLKSLTNVKWKYLPKMDNNCSVHILKYMQGPEAQSPQKILIESQTAFLLTQLTL